MKKAFLNPEVQIVALQIRDIVTASTEGEDIIDGGDDDGEDVEIGV